MDNLIAEKKKFLKYLIKRICSKVLQVISYYFMVFLVSNLSDLED